MTELTLARVKKIQLLLFTVVIVMLFFGGCSRQEAEEGASPETMAVSLSGGVDISTMGTEAWQSSPATGSAEDLENAGNAEDPDTAGNPDGVINAAVPEMELNPNSVIVDWQGMDYMSSCRTIGGDSIYCTGFEGRFTGDKPAEGPYFAGRIGIEESEIQPFALEIPENMFVYRGCTDSQGRWHLLLSQKNGNAAEPDQKTEIWIVNRDGELEQSIDITEYTGENWFCLWMAVDHEGIYYMAGNSRIQVIDTVEQSVAALSFGGDIMGIGIGRSGTLYGVFCVEGNNLLGKIDTGSGSIEKCADLEGALNSSFSILQEGAQAELLLANKGNGVWSYDGTELKQELLFHDLMINGQDILAIGFLWDGRMCVMCYEGGKDVFHYIPVEA